MREHARTGPGVVGALCGEMGGVARTQEFAAFGITPRALRRSVAAGEVIRARQGVYLSPDLPVPIRVAVRHGGVLACASVARLHGLWVLPIDELVHVALPPNGHSRPHDGCDCVQHWNALPVSPTEVTLVDALVQIRGCLGDDAFFASLESGLHLGLVTPARRRELRNRITESARWLVDLARTDAESGLESLLRVRLHPLGISVKTQVDVAGVGRVDFVLGDRLILEVDGRNGHDDDEGRHKDLLRDAVAASHGFDTLRFDYAMVVHEWEVVEQAILGKLVRGLHLDPWAEQLRPA
jgi:very-short-patch-repair endonuclease